MKKVFLNCCVMSVLLLTACSTSSIAETSVQNSLSQSATSASKVVVSEKDVSKESSPTRYTIINDFHSRMTEAFGEQTPELTQGKYDNIWNYNFGDFVLQVYVTFDDVNSNQMNLEMSETDTTNEGFLSEASKIFEVLLGDLSDDEYAELIAAAKDSMSIYDSKELSAKLTPINNIDYYEQVASDTTNRYTIKAVYKK